MSIYSGSWTLVSAVTLNTKIPFVEPDAAAEIATLTVSAHGLLPESTAAHGLTMHITADHAFRQQVNGQPKIEWFDVEGVLDKSVTPFDGSGFSVSANERLYLIADERPEWATPKDESKLNLFRCDTGDTLICDFVESATDKLARTINVLTDGKRLSKTLLMFTHDSSAV